MLQARVRGIILALIVFGLYMLIIYLIMSFGG